MNENTSSVTMMLLFTGRMLLVFGLIFVLALITPKLANICKKIFGKGKNKQDLTPDDDGNNVITSTDKPEHVVRGIYDAQSQSQSQSQAPDTDEEKDKEKDSNGSQE